MLTVYVEPSSRHFRLDCKWDINLHCKYNVFFKILLARCWKFKISLTSCWNWSLSDEYMNWSCNLQYTVVKMKTWKTQAWSCQQDVEFSRFLAHHIINICCTCDSQRITQRSNPEFSWHFCSSLRNHFQAFIYIVLRWKGNATLIF